MKGEGQQKARGLGAFRGESKRRACYSSRIWGQFPSRLFFLEPLLLPLKRLPRCSAPPAGSRAPGIPRGRREDDDRPLTVVRGDAGLSVPGPALFPSICFPNAAGGRCAECPVSFFPFFLPFFLRSLAPRCSPRARMLVHLPRPDSLCPPRGSPQLPGGWRGAGSREPLAGRGAAHGWSAWRRENGPKKRWECGSLTFVFFCGQWYCSVRLYMLSGDMSSFNLLGGSIKS